MLSSKKDGGAAANSSNARSDGHPQDFSSLFSRLDHQRAITIKTTAIDGLLGRRYSDRVLRALSLFLLLVVACHRAATDHTAVTPGPVTPGPVAPGPVAMQSPPDPHSFARPDEVRVRHFGLQLEVDFDARTLTGVITLAVQRADKGAPLVLDTRALTIDSVEVAHAPAPIDASTARLATLDAPWQTAAWRMGTADADLGAALIIEMTADVDVVRVRYRTAPSASGLQWLTPAQTADGVAPFLYSQSQAIHARSWFPCQDSPGIRTSYDAEIRVPAPLRALMAADPIPDAPAGVAAFAMRQPIPAYLVALAVGHLEFAALGERTGVWAEPSVLPRAAHEFADIERMMLAIEGLYGPYRWGRYDVLVLPPAFPFGGMENPKLTFATPTIIAGDRSLVSLIAHELAHSWSGNLVTNATWADLWLNEGFTVYLERRIIEALFGRERADMDAVLGRQDLAEALGELAPDDQRLRLDLAGRDPDVGLSDVAYEKGALLLRAFEETYGRAVFDPVLLAWFDRHAFGSVTTVQFEAFVAEHLQDATPLPGRNAVDLSAWLDAPGVPTDAPVPKAEAFARIDAVIPQFVAGTVPAAALATDTWSAQQWLHFLRALPRDTELARLRALDTRFGLGTSGNIEILALWLEIGVRHGYRELDSALEQFLLTIGRRKFVVPLYRGLLDAGRGDDARRIFARARPGYHPITQGSLDALLGGG